MEKCVDDEKYGFSAFVMKHKREEYEEVWNFESIHNINIGEVELGCTMQSLMRQWNMTVQWWMSEHVHKRLPFNNYYLKLLITLAISAFWHGIHGGYYLSFFSSLLMVLAQSGVKRCLSGGCGDGAMYRWLSWFFLFRYIDYIAVPFMLLEWDVVVVVWWKMWFYGHVVVVGVFLATNIVFMIKKKNRKEKI